MWRSCAHLLGREPTRSHADVLARDGFRGHAGGGFTRVDVLDDGEIVATFVPLTGRDEIL
jgi:hypothetical protein